MLYIEAPQTYTLRKDETTLFLAGGITGTPNWQGELIELIRHTSFVVFNPRRKFFPIGDPSASEQQIKWEYHCQRIAHHILFWFPHESVCPIALYELGAWSMTKKPITIGVHPDYPRRSDVEIQMKLARPEVTIVYSLPDLANITIASL